jgi:PAS domain S-box-containing protein
MKEKDKRKDSTDLRTVNKALAIRIKENEKKEAELTIANTDLKAAEAAVRKLNAELEQKVIKRSAQYAFISQVNQTIVHVKDEATLFRKSCSLALEFGKFKMAWIGRFDTEHKKINLIESSGISTEDIQLFKDVSYEIDGPQDTLLRTKIYFLCNDIVHEPKLEKWKLFAAKNGLNSFIVIPILKSGHIIGTFNLYATELHFFEPEDIKLAIEVTGDISFALDLFEKAKRHHETEELIVQNEMRFRALIENSADMILLSTANGEVIYGSPSITKLLGYSIEEILNISVFDFVHPDDIHAFLEKRAELLLYAGESYQFQVRLKHQNNNWIWCESTITNRLHEVGIEAMVSNFRDISEKKAIESKQAFDKYNLNALINNTNDIMWSVDKDFKLITSNEPFNDFIKLISGHSIKKGDSVFSENFSPDQVNRFKKYYERAFAGEAFSEIEYTEFPEEYWNEISYYPIGEGDQIIGTACHTRDITGVKKTEQQLSKSEAFNRGVLNSLNSHLAVIDGSGEIVAVNESWNRFAYQNGDSKLVHTGEGENYFDVCEKAAQAGDKIALEALHGIKATMDEGEKQFYLEYPCHSPNKHRWFGMRALKFENDEPMIIVVHTEITERKNAEINLIRSEAQLKEAQALSHISNWELDLITGVNTWSDEFYTIFGFGKDEINPSQETFLSLIHPDDFEFAKECVAIGFQTLHPGSFNARIKKKDGSIRFIFTEWEFELDSYQKPIRLFGILQDITERKTAEQEREKLTSDLIQRNQDLEQFTFIISHNLRAPTANIIGFTEILLDETITPQEHQEMLKGLSTSVTTLDSVIKDINAILQVKEEVNEKKELIHFSALVNDISISIGNIIDKHQVQILSEFSQVDEIFSLKAYLHSIFYNLISNSIKYRKPNEPILIEIKSNKKEGKIVLTFKDNGLGFDLTTKGDQVFGLYKRFHSHVEGKGMGLFMVKTQLEAIGGKISVASEPNIGSIFTIEFNF